MNDWTNMFIASDDMDFYECYTVARSSHSDIWWSPNDTSDTILLGSSHASVKYQYQYWTLWKWLQDTKHLCRRLCCVHSTMLPDTAAAISWPDRDTDPLLTNLNCLYCPKSKPEMYYHESSANHCKCWLQTIHSKITWEIWEHSTNSLVHFDSKKKVRQDKRKTYRHLIECLN